MQGRLKGKKWIKGSGVNGYWLGSYEKKQSEIIGKTLKKGEIFFDIGANVGFYSLLAAEIVREEGQVFSFEPLPQNFEYLKKHIAINNYKNIFPYQFAVSEKSGSAFFGEIINPAQGRLVENGTIRVKTIALDDWIQSKKLPIPKAIKIDVEGEEFSVLKGSQCLISKNKPIIFLSIHNKEAYQKCCEYLSALGYSLTPIEKSDFSFATEIVARP